jgi:FtsP/CotA-like multicopper oxidase with cupredoxin domain
MIAGIILMAAQSFGQTLIPTSLTKFMDPLPVPGAMPQSGVNFYEIGMYQIQQQLHSQLPPTTLYGYGASQATASYPSATIEALRGVPIQIHWTNNLPGPHILAASIDTTLDLADWSGVGVPTVVHVHGFESEPASDGTPYQWFTANYAETGRDWVHETFNYYNTQEPATIWFHDHALGLTRLNVMAGLAGFYLLRDPAIEGPMNLPSGPYEIPLVIQDRSFNIDGSLWYPTVGINPTIHPKWIPEFFGNVMLVNGKVWPFLTVEQRKYRFRMLNGCNARFLELRLIDPLTGNPGPEFWQIGGDDGYLPAPVLLNDPLNPASPRLIFGPGERADVIIDFSEVPVGTNLLLRNSAKAPYPKGTAADPQTTGQVMQFRVVAASGPDNSSITANHAPLTFPTPDRIRTLTLNELDGPLGPVGAFLDGKPFTGTATELPVLGTTEVWEIVNLTADSHPIHLHFVPFTLLNRQNFQVTQYARAYSLANPVIPSMSTATPPITPYLKGAPIPPNLNEVGWKDTYQCPPGMVTRFIIRFTPQDGVSPFAFDPTSGPGYVWHCHILEHEENDMMRPLIPVNPPAAKMGIASRLPQVVSLAQNYPNPFNAVTNIPVSLTQAADVRLDIFNLLGERVVTLLDKRMQAGSYQVSWDAGIIASGTYLIRLSTDSETRTRRMTLLK